MTSQEIERIKSTRPFEPFRVLVADRKKYDVRHTENLAFAGNKRLIAIGMVEHFVTMDLPLVTGIRRPIPQKKNGRHGRAA
jgi:hypothetical protein